MCVIRVRALVEIRRRLCYIWCSALRYGYVPEGALSAALDIRQRRSRILVVRPLSLLLGHSYDDCG